MTEVKLDNSLAVRKWLASLKESTGLGYKWHLEAFMDWVKINGGKFAGKTPDDLIEFGLDATPREMNELLDLKKNYLLSMTGRLNHKKNADKSIKSFFSYNRVEVPKDRTLNLRGDLPKVEGSLTPDDLKKIVLSSNPAFQATFLIMLGSGMGQDEFIEWSNTEYADLMRQLDAGAHQVKISLHGRKGDKNDYNYHTYIGGDALNALKRYLKLRGNNPGAIFSNNIHKPATQDALYQYFSRKIQRLGIHRGGEGWSGITPHGIRDVYRTLWRRSGVPVEFGEYFMGHRGAFDKYGYDRTAQDEDELRKQYSVALPWLNILSENKPFKLVHEDEVTRLRKELEDSKRMENTRVAELEAKNTVIEAKLDKAIKALEEIFKQSKPK